MSKLKLVTIISVLLVMVLLISSCDIGNSPNPGIDGNTDPPSQTTPGTDTSGNPADECVHKFGEWEIVIDSTCTQKGKQVRVCSLCMHIENGDIDLKAHTVETLAKLEPTCKVEGKTEGEKCSVCQTILKPQETIPTVSHSYDNGNCTVCGDKEPACLHTYGEWNTVKNATCTAEGLKERSCDLCGVKEQATIPTAEHTEVIDQAVEPTCTETGLTKGKHCSACGQTLVAQQEIKAIGHTYINGECHCGEKEEDLSAKPQFIVSNKDAKHGDTIEVTVALKNNPGVASIILSVAFDSDSLTLTEVVYNSAIGGQTVQPQNMNSPVKLYWINGFADAEGDFVLATLKFTVKSDATVGDHNITLNYNADDVYDISETNLPFENVSGKVTVIAKEVECKHTYGEWNTVKNATCTAEGLKERSCTLCGKKEQDKIAIAAHAEVIDKANDPTCTETGLTEGKHCSVCKEVLVAQETIKAKGHKYTEGVCHCGAKDENYIHPTTYSEGLEYELSNDGTYYIVSSIGKCTDTKLVIPSTHENLPVKEIGEEAFYKCKIVENVILPEGIVSIGKSAFSDCDELVSITLPQTLREIGDNAFAYSSELKSISIPEGVTVIGYETFRYCYSLENVVLPDSVIEIGAYAFCHCDITEIKLPDKLEVIGEHAFYVCDKLQEITIPGSVTQIGKYAFWDCKSLTQISIEEGVKTIDPYAFYGCSALTDISIPDSIESIGTYAFSGCEKLKTIILPEKLKTIGIAAFYYCSALESITIPENITSIENITFNGCKSLVSIDLPNSVKKIGNSAFAGCEALTEINIPNELISIGDSAFWNCKSLKSLEFPKTLQSFSKTTTQTPFSGCSALESIAVHADNPYYLSYKNCVIEKTSQTVIFGIGNCELPDDGSVEKIDDDALRNLDELTSIRIPDGTVSIGNRVFYDCNNLKEIVIPNSIQTIGYYAFMKCNNLETIIFMGTEEEWANVTKGNDWDGETGTYTIQFLDEEVPEEKTYTVTFKDYNGTTLSTQSVKEGTAATAPQNPTRDGYEFTGWDKDFNNVTSDITVTATYEKVVAEPQFIVSNKDAKRGDMIEVTVALKNNPGIASIILSVAFDSDALTLTEVIYNSSIGGQTVQPQNMNSPVKLYWINGFADAEGDFVLVTLKFTVNSDAALGDHDITLSYNADDIYDISETNLPFEIVNGKITVKQ